MVHKFFYTSSIHIKNDVFLHPFLKNNHNRNLGKMKFNGPIIGLLLISLLLACNPKQKETITIIPESQKNHLQLEGVFDQVKTITINKYYALDPNGDVVNDSALFVCSVKHYDPNGHLKKVVIMNHDKDTMSVRFISYNAQSKIIKDELFDSTGNKIEYTIYHNDSRGFRTKEEHFVRDSLMQTLIYKNDGFGNVLEITDVRPLYTVKKKFENNEVGLPIRIDEFDPEGTLFKFITVEYDNYGDAVNRKVFRKDGTLLEYTYTQYNTDRTLSKEIYENMKFQVQDVGIYQNYDAHKNWTKEIRKISGRAQFIIERTIEYY